MWSARRKSWSGLDIAPGGLSVLAGEVFMFSAKGAEAAMQIDGKRACVRHVDAIEIQMPGWIAGD